MCALEGGTVGVAWPGLLEPSYLMGPSYPTLRVSDCGLGTLIGCVHANGTGGERTAHETRPEGARLGGGSP